MVRLGKKTDEQDRKHWRCWEEGGLRWSILSHLVDGAFQLPTINTLRGGSKIGLGKKSYKLPPLRHCLQVKFKVFFLIKKRTVEINFKKNEMDIFAYSQFLQNLSICASIHVYGIIWLNVTCHCTSQLPSVSESISSGPHSNSVRHCNFHLINKNIKLRVPYLIMEEHNSNPGY